MIAAFSRSLLKTPLWAVVVASALVSVWKISSAPLINTDGILYLIAANGFLDSGVAASFDIYHWPFLQVLTAILHQISGLSLLLSAQIVMTTCFALLALGFCNAVRAMGGDDTTTLIAFLVIICHSVINDLRSSIIRDPGMLAFLLLAFSEQVRFSLSLHWKHSIRWALYIFIAFLFRVEAFAIALLAPLAMLAIGAHTFPTRILATLQLLALPIVAVVVAAIAYFGFSMNGIGEFKLFKDLEFMAGEFRNLTAGVSTLSAVIRQDVLADFSADDASLALISVMLTVTMANVLRSITLPYFIPLLTFLKWPVPLPLKGYSRQLLSVYCLIITTYLFCFTLFTQFNLTRYCLQLGLLALLPLPFILAHWWQQPGKRRMMARCLIAFLLTANTLDSLISSGYKKIYLREAALWAKEAPAIASGSLISNEPYISYFSAKASQDNVLKSINAARQPLTGKPYTHWAAGFVYGHRAREGDEQTQLRADIAAADGNIIKVFPGQDGRAVFFFSVARDIPRSPLLLEHSP